MSSSHCRWIAIQISESEYELLQCSKSDTLIVIIVFYWIEKKFFLDVEIYTITVLLFIKIFMLCGSVAASGAGNPGSITAAYTNRRDWWLSSVILLLGDKDIWMVLVT